MVILRLSGALERCVFPHSPDARVLHPHAAVRRITGARVSRPRPTCDGRMPALRSKQRRWGTNTGVPRSVFYQI